MFHLTLQALSSSPYLRWIFQRPSPAISTWTPAVHRGTSRYVAPHCSFLVRSEHILSRSGRQTREKTSSSHSPASKILGLGMKTSSLFRSPKLWGVQSCPKKGKTTFGEWQLDQMIQMVKHYFLHKKTTIILSVFKVDMCWPMHGTACWTHANWDPHDTMFFGCMMNVSRRSVLHIYLFVYSFIILYLFL